MAKIVERTKQINLYDFNKMLNDYDTKSRHEEYLKNIRKRLAKENKTYNENIEHMKEYRENEYQKKNKALIKKLKDKEKFLITALETKEKENMKEKQRAIAIMMEKEEQAKTNVQRNLVEQEKQRLQFQKDIHKKSN